MARALLEALCPWPSHLADLSEDAFREARLVWENAARHYEWHLVIEDG